MIDFLFIFVLYCTVNTFGTMQSKIWLLKEQYII